MWYGGNEVNKESRKSQPPAWNSNRASKLSCLERDSALSVPHHGGPFKFQRVSKFDLRLKNIYITAVRRETGADVKEKKTIEVCLNEFIDC